MKRTFRQTKHFALMLDQEKNPNLLLEVEKEILKDPTSAPIVAGTGGIQKIRIPGKGKGKSGGYRVLYLDLSARGITVLLAIYSKGFKENISDDEKKVLKEMALKLKGERS